MRAGAPAGSAGDCESVYMSRVLRDGPRRWPLRMTFFLNRNYLKGRDGDSISAVLATAGDDVSLLVR